MAERQRAFEMRAVRIRAAPGELGQHALHRAVVGRGVIETEFACDAAHGCLVQLVKSLFHHRVHGEHRGKV